MQVNNTLGTISYTVKCIENKYTDPTFNFKDGLYFIKDNVHI